MKMLADEKSCDEEQTESTGEERMGSTDLLSNFGVTMIILVIVIVFIMVTAVISSLLCRCIKLSEKYKKKVADFKSSIFFASPIRFTMVNSLKLNLSSLLVLKVAGD